jgi:hypothetical protein
MFLQSGVEVMVMEELPGGRVLVDEWCELGEEYQEPRGAPFIVKKEQLFEAAPVTVISKEVKALQIKKDTLLEEIRKIEGNISVMNISVRTATAEYQKWGELKNLNLFVQKKITHYVELHYGTLSIVEFGKAKCEGARDELKLLTLFGTSKGNLQWKLNQYSDGSGSSYEVVPCLSYEDARSQMQAWLDRLVAADQYLSEQSIKNAAAYGLFIRPSYIERIKVSRRAEIQRAIDGRLADIEKWKKEMETL